MQIADKNISGLLVDLDGVLYVGEQVIAGSIETVQKLNELGLPHCFVTNTTTHSRTALVQKLSRLGFDIAPQQVMTAPLAARNYLERKGWPPCKLLLADEVLNDFEGFEQSDTDAEVVVIGDIGSAWTYELLNQVFRLVMNGATLVALHKNKFWQTGRGLMLDIGAFVTGLEYCTGKDAVVVGKPDPHFFQAAVDQLGLEVDKVAMVGDDIDSDVGGAQHCGLGGILVRTGKYRREYAEASAVRPDLVIESFAALPLDAG